MQELRSRHSLRRAVQVGRVTLVASSGIKGVMGGLRINPPDQLCIYLFTY